MTVLLFAYGSNMAAGEMERFAPGATFTAIARLPGFRLEFRRRSRRQGGGAADVVERAGEEVWGVLYELPAAELAAIDEKEGAGFAYERRTVTVETGDGPRDAIAYVVIEKEREEVPPTLEYATQLIEAAEARRLPAGYREALARRIHGLTSVTSP